MPAKAIAREDYLIEAFHALCELTDVKSPAYKVFVEVMRVMGVNWCMNADATSADLKRLQKVFVEAADRAHG